MDERVAGGSGMGAAAARRLASDSFRVAILSSGNGEAPARELGGFGVTGSNRPVDDLRRLVDGAMARWARIDMLVNSAGHGPRAPRLDLTDDQWHAGMERRTARLALPAIPGRAGPGWRVRDSTLPRT